MCVRTVVRSAVALLRVVNTGDGRPIGNAAVIFADLERAEDADRPAAGSAD